MILKMVLEMVASSTDLQDLQISINPEYQMLVPSMPKAAFNALVSHIAENGQLIPITVNQKGQVLDGHHRLKACQLLNRKPLWEKKIFKNLFEEKLYVIDVNLQRRQLSEAQRIQLALRKKPIFEELAKLNQSLAGKSYGKGIDSCVQICTELSPIGRVNEAIARDAGVSARQVSKVEMILQKGSKDQIFSVFEASTSSIDQTYKEIGKAERRQQLVNEARTQTKIKLPENIKLIQGDFVKKSKEIPDDSVDLIFTDPPYDREHLYLYADLAEVADRILKLGGSLIAYVGTYLIPEAIDLIRSNGPQLRWNHQLVMIHTGSTKAMPWPKVFVGYKPLLWYVKGVGESNAPEYTADVIPSKQPDKIGHDWEQSPVEAEHCIRRITVEDQIIFDPMMGYATTGIAALRLNRKFIGIEIDKEHFEAAQLRIRKELESAEGKL